VTGAGTGSGLSASTSVTAGGFASIDLTTSTVSGEEFTVTAGDNGFIVSDTSALITVVTGGFNRLAVNIQSPQTNQLPFVGAPLTSTVTAQDTFGNTVTNFDTSGETVTITSSAGAVVVGNSIPAANFTAGVADLVAESTTFGGNYAGGPVTFTATSAPAGVFASSTPVTMLPGAADHFTIVTNIGSPQTVGAGFVVRIEALDIDNNLLNVGINAYNENDAVLSDIGPDTLSVVPSTLQFINGVWESTVTTTQANSGANQTTLQVIDTVGLVTLAADTEGPFTVDPGVLHHFTFVAPLPDPNETVASSFPISIEARDAFDNRITSYNGINLATISVSVGNIVEQSDGDSLIDFAAGAYSGNVVIDTEQNGSVITVSDNGIQGTGTENGTSTSFNVIGNDIFISLAEYRTPKTASTGDNVVMMELLIENRNNLDPLTLNGIDVWVESSSNTITRTVSPNTLIELMFVEDITNVGGPYNSASIPGNDSTPVTVPLPGINVPVLSDITLRIGVRILDDISNAAVPNIILRLADVNGDLGGSPVTNINADTGALIQDPDGFIYSGITNISTNAETSAYNYPNPFNPNKQTTSIVYSSNSTGTTTIKIFTITGKIVRTITDNAVVGSNEALWDGKNGRRQVVRNGVYVAVVMPPDGSKSSVKIAVVK